MWLPEGWWIITEKSTDGTRFTAGAKGLPEIESSAKFRSDRDATGVARKALRSMAYENQDSGWSKFRCHARLPGQLKAFCGARIENSPNTKHAYSEPCGKCERIVESIPDPDEAENDIKKHFRYVSFNSERNPEVNSKEENHEGNEDNKPHLCVPTLDGNAHVIPTEVFDKIISGEMKITDMDDWEIITRTAFSEWLRGLETAAKTRVYKAAVDHIADTMAAGGNSHE